jgi:M6 family metalloprotease-like protein
MQLSFCRLTGKITLVALALFYCFGTAAASERNTVLVPRQFAGPTQSGYIPPNPKPEPLRSMVSQKNLLGLERETPYGLPKQNNLALDTQVDTVNILVLKIEFQMENPDDPTTTGNGNLDMRSYDQFLADEGHYFDPAPHNSAYFSAHMQALARYYDFVSDRRLKLTWEICPRAESIAIRLPHPISYYGSGGVPDSIIPGLSRYFDESIRAADSLYPELDFSRYQSIFLFHAGSDQQNNFYFIEDTPNDLWTGFIMMEHAVEVDNGRNSVREGLIMPETACQDNRITCLNAVIAHEFGHQLGLVDIYNTANFLTQVGNYSLMDNNGMSVSLDFGDGMNFVSGTMPVYPDAWSRAYLGFSGVTEVTNGENIRVRAAEQNYHTNEIIKVPISDQEYFLIENRQVEADFTYRFYANPITNALLADSATGVVLGPGYAYNGQNRIIKVPTGEYDRLLPGNGVLIWHVDEAVAYMDYLGSGGNNFLLNTLQWDHTRRFLTIVEADGIIDFGGDYVSSGYYGSDAEYYKAGNNIALTPTSRPNSHDNLGADSHISITGIVAPDTSNASDTIMTCTDIVKEWQRPGFPQMAIPDLGYNGGGLLAIAPFSAGHSALFAASGNYIVAINPDGSPFINNNFGLLLPRFDGDSLIYNFAIFARLDSAISGKLIAGNFRGNDTLQIACIDKSARLYLFDPLDQAPQDSLADLIAALELPAELSAGPLAYDFNRDGRDEILVGLADSTIHILQLDDDNSLTILITDTLPGVPIALAASDSSIIAITQNAVVNDLNIGWLDSTGFDIKDWNSKALPAGRFAGLAVGDLDRDSNFDIVATIGDNLVIYDGGGETIKSVNIVNPGAPALGDINSDGCPEIIFVGGDSFIKLYAYNYLGIQFERFPLKLNYKHRGSETPYSEPLIADLNDDNSPDVIISLPQGGLDCYDYLGSRLPGFPLGTSTSLLVPACVNDIDRDGILELAALDSCGFVSAWNLDVTDSLINLPWPMAAGGYKGNAWLSPSYNKEIITAPGFLAEKSVYNYPNPATNQTSFRYYVDRQAQVYVTIYDITGEKIAELTGTSPGGVESELIWDCSRFASGVYFANFEAKAADISSKKLIKVALVK